MNITVKDENGNLATIHVERKVEFCYKIAQSFDSGMVANWASKFDDLTVSLIDWMADQFCKTKQFKLGNEDFLSYDKFKHGLGWDLDDENFDLKAALIEYGGEYYKEVIEAGWEPKPVEDMWAEAMDQWYEEEDLAPGLMEQIYQTRRERFWYLLETDFYNVD